MKLIVKLTGTLGTILILSITSGWAEQAPSEAAPAPMPEQSGATIYQSACMSCHSADGKTMKLGPPMFAVKDHLIKAVPEREAFIDRVVTWVKAPQAETALMPGAVGKFGLMPAQTQLTDDELKQVAEFLYDTDMAQPDWYAEHYQAEHGVKP